MAKLTWDDTGKRFYETGVKKAVLYPQTGGKYPKGVAWNGLTKFTLSPSGAEASPIYADDIKYLNLMSAEEIGATIEAYTYPDEFDACNGVATIATGVTAAQQTRKPFGFSCVTTVGNDTEYNDHGYKIHIVYGAMASPSEKAYETVNNDPNTVTFSWELTTTPVAVKGFKPTAYLCIDSRTAPEEKMKQLEEKLYGGSGEAELPLPDEIITLVGSSIG